MTSTPQEKLLYHGIRENAEYLNITKPRFFENKDMREVFSLDKEFYDKYKQIASKYQLWEIIRQTNNKELSEGKLDSIFDVDLNSYDKNWLKEHLEAWIELKTLHASVEDLVEYLNTTKADAENAKEVVQVAKDIILKRNNISLDDDLGLDFYDPISHEQSLLDTFPTGYPFLNDMLGGGFQKKTLVAFLGRIKIGKSIWLSNIAANAVKNGVNTVYVSFEMKDKKVVKRLGANLLDVRVDQYDEFSRNPSKIKSRFDRIGEDRLLSTPGSLTIKEYPASSVGVPDVERFLQKLEERKGEKLQLIVIDYINIMQDWHSPHSDNTYLKIKRIAEDLRAMATRNEWCVVTATQVTRDAFGSNDLSLSNVSESVGLLNTVDAMFGIIQDEMMKLGGDERRPKYLLKALALRDAEGTDSKQEFLIDYNFMRITQNLEAGTITDADFSNL